MEKIWQDYQTANKERFLNELLELLRIPSVSANPDHKADMGTAAGFLKKNLLASGFDRAEIFQTEGHPIVYGEKIQDPAKPTILVYGHYDVQPVDPVGLWDNDPFDPTIKEGKIYGRGTADDKGQVFMQVKAAETMIQTGLLPCNVKVIIEGEEEVGSTHLAPFLQAHKDLLQCDVVLVSDTAMISLETPSIDTGIRGLAYMEVEVTGPNRDLHSGVYGGAVANPINVLAQMIAKLQDDKGHITIPGFYDKVATVDAAEREKLNQAPFDLKAYEEDLGIRTVAGEEGYTTIERTGIRPTLDVNGIWGGFEGVGAKTVLPSKAYAKISMRLVPDQKSDDIATLFTRYFESLAPESVTVKVTYLHGGEAALIPTDSHAYQAADRAIRETFGKVPIPVRSGGSIPIVPLFQEVLGVQTILLGFGLDSDNIHSPNEKYGLENFYKGIETIPYFYKFFAEK